VGPRADLNSYVEEKISPPQPGIEPHSLVTLLTEVSWYQLSHLNGHKSDRRQV